MPEKLTDKEMANLAAEAESERIHFLTDENRRLQSKLSRLENRQEGLYDATLQAAKDAVSLIKFPAAAKPIHDQRTKTAEVACVALGDWQLGKVTPTYSTEICAKRIGKLAEKVIELTEIQRADHPVREVHVWLIGDLGEGELIFPGQEHEIELSLFEQVLLHGPEILGTFLREMLAHFEKVKIAWCLGNHGRVGGRQSRQMKPRNNSDRMIYATTKLLLESEKRLIWIKDPFTYENWYALDRIGKTQFLLFHGDQVRGQLGLPYYGYAKAITGWASGAVPEGFDHAIAGHFHTHAKLTFNHRHVWLNGSIESMNVYAQENMKAMSRPSQQLIFVHPQKGVTGEYAVWLD